MIKITKLNYSYGQHRVLDGIDLSLEDGGYFALAGLNGAGKSTLIKLILDLLRTQNQGDILINGLSSWEVSSRTQVIYLPEKFSLSANVTAMDYFKMLAGVYQQKHNIHSINEYCATLGFSEKSLTSKANTYSKGMMQKVGLIGCLSIDVPFLLLDEPLSGLDPKARLQVKRLLLEKKNSNKTLLYSTHMLADVDELCDSFGILHNGSLKFVGTPQECQSHYNSQTLEQAYMSCIDQ